MDDGGCPGPRQRASSPEASNSRPKPFDETPSTSRKRQKTSAGGSSTSSLQLSRSNTPSPNLLDGHEQPLNDRDKLQSPLPNPKPSLSANRVILDLRSAHVSSDMTERLHHGPESTHNDRIAVSPDLYETSMTEKDPEASRPALITPSCSPSGSDQSLSEIEIITLDEGPDQPQSPLLRIISDDGSGSEIQTQWNSHLRSFPFQRSDEDITDTIQRLQNFFQHGISSPTPNDISDSGQILSRVLSLLNYSAIG